MFAFCMLPFVLFAWRFVWSSWSCFFFKSFLCQVVGAVELFGFGISMEGVMHYAVTSRGAQAPEGYKSGKYRRRGTCFRMTSSHEMMSL